MKEMKNLPATKNAAETKKPAEVKLTSAKIPKKKSVILLFLLSIITLGLYPMFWFIKRSPEINNLKTKSKLTKKSAVILLIFYILFTISLISLQITASLSGVTIPNVTDPANVPIEFQILFIITLIFGLISLMFLLILTFRVRKILNEVLANKQTKRKVSGLFTLIFNIYYLQYEINRIIDDKEMKKRIGPWTFFILGILLIISLILLAIFGNTA